MNRDRWIIALVALVTIASMAVCLESAEGSREGVVISAPGREGVLPKGGLFTSWGLEDETGLQLESGSLSNPIDLNLAWITAAPRGRFILHGTDENHETSYEVPVAGIGAETRPWLPLAEAGAYEDAWRKREAEPDTASASLLSLARGLARRGRLGAASSVALQALKLAQDAGLANEAYRATRGWLTEPAQLALAARTRGSWESHEQRWAEATLYFAEALAIDQGNSSSELLIALDYMELGRIADSAGRALEALDFYQKTVAIRQRVAPASMALWIALFNRHIPESVLGQLDQSVDTLKTAQALIEELAPESLRAGLTMAGLGRLAWQRADLRQAELLYGRAIRVVEPLAPGSLRLASLWNNMGLVAYNRGNLVHAERLFSDALDVQQRLGSGTPSVANTLNNLGMISNERGRYQDADAFYGRALEIYEAIQPESLAVARTLNNRANNARRAGRLESSERDVKRSRAITALVAPESRTHSTGLEVLTLLYEVRGDYEQARELLEGAIADFDKAAPDTLRVARPLNTLGRILRKLDQGETAKKKQQEALGIVQKVAPGSVLEARILNELGLVERRGGDARAGARFLCRAVRSLDEQKLRLGGNRKAGNPFDRETAHIYRDCIEALLQLGRTSEAYEILEMSRARELLILLADRDLGLDDDLPEELRDWRRKLHREYDKVFAELLTSEALESSPERALIETRLAELRQQQEQLDRQLRDANPRLAALESPRSLSSQQALRAIDAGTLLLSYSLGEESTHVFAIGTGVPSGLEAHQIPMGAKQIEELVGTFRRQIVERAPGARSSARALWDLLIAPLEPRLRSHDRVLFSLEGGLHGLPFAALLSPEKQYLIEHLPIHFVSSATVYAELRQRSSGKKGRLLVFADPEVPEGLGVGLRMATEAGEDPTASGLPALPGSRREASVIAKSFPGPAEVFLGAEASEGRFKLLATGASHLHLATHGYLDTMFPLDSGLVFAASQGTEAKENGLLQAWEIFEQLELDADLVTLSSCETALGQDLPGEGLIGLTRAFQYAGARSIVASLWKVEDDKTARFMERFYQELGRGLPKDEALRLATLALLQGTSGVDQGSPPARGVGGLGPSLPAQEPSFAWAAFQLIGDRR